MLPADGPPLPVGEQLRGLLQLPLLLPLPHVHVDWVYVHSVCDGPAVRTAGAHRGGEWLIAKLQLHIHCAYFRIIQLVKLHASIHAPRFVQLARIGGVSASLIEFPVIALDVCGARDRCK